MLFREFLPFQKFLTQKGPFSLGIILGKNIQEAIWLFLSQWKERPVLVDPVSFSKETFFQDVETRPFFGKTCMHLHDCQELTADSIQTIHQFLKKPSPWVVLLLSGESLPAKNPLNQEVDNNGGIILKLEEKPWEKDKRKAFALMQEALKSGVEMSSQVCDFMVKRVGDCAHTLKNELNKLICYVGDRKRITETDVIAIATMAETQTLWKLGDALFMQDFEGALRIAQMLIQQNTPLLTILAHLRTQMLTNREVLEIYLTSGHAKVCERFPYLKGALLEKKIEMVHNYGHKGFQNLLEHLFACELEAKNSSHDPMFYLEMLIFKLMVCSTYSLTALP